MSSPKIQQLSSMLKDYAPYVTGASVLRSVDVPYVLQTSVARMDGIGIGYISDEVDESGVPMMTPALGSRGLPGLASGLFVMEKGPFLRGKIINSDAVDVITPSGETASSGAPVNDTVPRNLGDELAFEGNLVCDGEEHGDARGKAKAECGQLPPFEGAEIHHWYLALQRRHGELAG